jgi:hypothetical protein
VSGLISLLMIQRQMSRDEAKSEAVGFQSQQTGKRKMGYLHFPPWRFVVAAIAGIVGTSVGWGNLRNERRKITSTIILLLGLAIWSYAVVGLLNWELADLHQITESESP